jgi:Na+/H+ antiporter NhaD/arsenite permease-like protein
MQNWTEILNHPLASVVVVALVLAVCIKLLMRSNTARFKEAHSARKIDKWMIVMFFLGLSIMVMASLGIGKSPEFAEHQAADAAANDTTSTPAAPAPAPHPSKI